MALIGVFDSGVGGLTVAKEIVAQMPGHDLIYLGDTARAPYGTKSAATVCIYAVENAEFLVDRGIDLLVVACNSASAVALGPLEEFYRLPIVGVINAGAAAAIDRTKNKKIGVIGTEATIQSGSYTRALKKLDPDVEVYTRACPLFVPLAEEGWIDNEVALATATTYLASLRSSGIDTLVLGCTHYPLLKDVIAKVMGPEVELVDSAATTAALVSTMLPLPSSKSGSMSFFVTDVPERFVKVGSRFMGQEVESAVRIEWGGGDSAERSW